MNFEVESKFAVPSNFEMSISQLREIDLELEVKPAKETLTTYFDTREFDLLSCGAALRFRVSAGDDPDSTARGVWTVKFAPPQSGQVVSRYEYEFVSTKAEIPGLFEPLLEVFGATSGLMPVAKLRAKRSSVLFRDASGALVLEIDDDLVLVEEGPNSGHEFREIEIELLNPSFELQRDKLANILLSSGASEAVSSSKLEQALVDTHNLGDISDVVSRYDSRVVEELTLLADFMVEVAENPKGGAFAFARRLFIDFPDGFSDELLENFIWFSICFRITRINEVSSELSFWRRFIVGQAERLRSNRNVLVTDSCGDQNDSSGSAALLFEEVRSVVAARVRPFEKENVDQEELISQRGGVFVNLVALAIGAGLEDQSQMNAFLAKWRQ